MFCKKNWNARKFSSHCGDFTHTSRTKGYIYKLCRSWSLNCAISSDFSHSNTLKIESHSNYSHFVSMCKKTHSCCIRRMWCWNDLLSWNTLTTAIQEQKKSVVQLNWWNFNPDITDTNILNKWSIHMLIIQTMTKSFCLCLQLKFIFGILINPVFNAS